MLPVTLFSVGTRIQAHDGDRVDGVDSEEEGQLHRHSPLGRHQLPPMIQPKHALAGGQLLQRHESVIGL